MEDPDRGCPKIAPRKRMSPNTRVEGFLPRRKCVEFPLHKLSSLSTILKLLQREVQSRKIQN